LFAVCQTIDKILLCYALQPFIPKSCREHHLVNEHITTRVLPAQLVLVDSITNTDRVST